MHTNRRTLLQLAGLAAPLALGAPVQAAPKPLRILILGGTGFIGPHQVRYALARGHKLTLFNRGRRPKEWPAEVVELTGDRNASDLKALETGEWDVCVDNPATLPFWVRDVGQVLKGRVKHYFYVSSLSVYASNDTPNDEDAPLQVYEGADAFAERKVEPRLFGPLKAVSEAEAVRQFGADKVTIIRPALIVGPGDETDRFTYWPVRLARGGEVLAPGDGTDPVQFIDARDLAEWMIRLAEDRRTGVFNATGPARPLTVRQMLDGVAAGVRAKPQLTWVPAEWLAEQKVSGWSDLPVWLPASGPTAAFHRRDHRRALATGLTYRPLPATAADTLAWFRSQPPERQAKLKAGLTPEREAELLAKWKARGA